MPCNTSLHGGIDRLSVSVIALRLGIGRGAVYGMLDAGIIPGIRYGRRWIVTRHAFEQWARTCGAAPPGGLPNTRIEGLRTAQNRPDGI